MKKLFLLLTIAVLFASCGKRVLTDEAHGMPDDTWMRFEPEAFAVEVSNIDVPYLITMTLKYDTTRFTDEALPLVVEFFADSNARHTLFPEIRLINRAGDRRGTVVDRFCTVVDTLDRCRLFNEAGRYTYRIKQRTSKYEIHGITSVGLKVEKI